MSDQNSSRTGKIILILFLMGFFGLLAAGAGTIIYLNRDKLNFAKKEDSSPSSEESKGSSQSESGSEPVAHRGSSSRPRVASSPLNAGERTFRKYMGRDDVLVLVDYYADWCGPCRRLSPTLSKLASAHGDKVVILKVNVDRERSLSSAAGVRSIPDVRLFHAGRQLSKTLGQRSYSHYEGLVLKHARRLPVPADPPPSTPQARPASIKPAQPGGSITPLNKDWLPPGVSPAGSS